MNDNGYEQLNLDLGLPDEDEKKGQTTPQQSSRTSNQCNKHSVVFKVFKHQYATYCKRCGRILDVRSK